MASQPPSPPPAPGQPVKIWVDGLRPVYGDVFSNIHLNSLTAKITLSVELSPERTEPVQLVVMPTNQLLALVNTLLDVVADPSFDSVAKESALITREVERLRSRLRPRAQGSPPSATN